MSTTTTADIGSLDLWTSAKVIGRECASVNKDFLLCKKELGDDPFKCMAKGDLVTSCNTAIVNQLKSKYTVEFDSFKKCLDYNDYRYANCRVQEKALYDCWNKDNYPNKG
eukprot:gene28506-37458_t